MSFPNQKYIVLIDSDVIDLSRNNKMSVYEISKDAHTKQGFESELDRAFDENNNEEIGRWSMLLQIYDECEQYVEDNLNPAFETIYSMIGVDNE